MIMENLLQGAMNLNPFGHRWNNKKLSKTLFAFKET